MKRPSIIKQFVLQVLPEAQLFCTQHVQEIPQPYRLDAVVQIEGYEVADHRRVFEKLEREVPSELQTRCILFRDGACRLTIPCVEPQQESRIGIQETLFQENEVAEFELGFSKFPRRGIQHLCSSSLADSRDFLRPQYGFSLCASRDRLPTSVRVVVECLIRFFSERGPNPPLPSECFLTSSVMLYEKSFSEPFDTSSPKEIANQATKVLRFLSGFRFRDPGTPWSSNFFVPRENFYNEGGARKWGVVLESCKKRSGWLHPPVPEEYAKEIPNNKIKSGKPPPITSPSALRGRYVYG